MLKPLMIHRGAKKYGNFAAQVEKAVFWSDTKRKMGLMLKYTTKALLILSLIQQLFAMNNILIIWNSKWKN